MTARSARFHGAASARRRLGAASARRITERLHLQKSEIMHVLPLVILGYATLIPPEVHVTISGLSFYVYRVLLYALAPIILRRAYLNLHRFNWWDLAILASALMLPVSIWVNNSFAEALESGMSVTIDLALTYLLARSTIRTTRDFQAFLIMMAPGLALAGLTLMVESLSREFIVRPVMASIFGSSEIVGVKYYYRLGLLRAYGPFSHPILAGLHLGVFLSMFWFAVKNPTYRFLGLAAGAMGFFTLSSGALIAIGISAGLIAYHRVQQLVVGLNWKHFFILAIVGLIILQFGSQNGAVSVVSRYLTFDSATASYRIGIWDYGTISVQNHPLFGVGLNEWERAQWMMVHDTIDAHFLWMAVRFGLPASLLLFVSSIAIMFKLGQRVSELPLSVERETRVGIIIALFAIVLMMFTVTLFGSTQIIFYITLGGAASLASANIVVRRASVERTEPAEPAPQTASFSGKPPYVPSGA